MKMSDNRLFKPVKVVKKCGNFLESIFGKKCGGSKNGKKSEKA